jgi:predicted phage terminase large subunit-like protein
MFSAPALKEVIDWWDNTMVSRLNRPKTDATVIIQQRVHELDLTGHELKNHPGKYEHLCIPMRYDGISRRTCLGPYDPRKKLGELLWAARFGEAEVQTLERSLGSYGTAAQLQQQPAPLGGGLIKLAWFQEYEARPERFNRIVQSWDTAQKEEVLSAFTVCETWGFTDDRHYLLDVYREQVDYPRLKKDAVNLALRDRQRYGRLDAVLIEDKSSGTSLIQDLRKTKGYATPIIAIEPEGDKVTRAATCSPTIEAKLVFLPVNAAWRPEFENEVSKFPNSATKDQVDSLSQYLNWANSRGFVVDLSGLNGALADSVAMSEDAPWNI